MLILCFSAPCLFGTSRPFPPRPGPTEPGHGAGLFIHLWPPSDLVPILPHRAPCRSLLRANHLSPNPSLLSDSNLNPSGCSPSPFPLVQSPAGARQQLASILSGINCTRNYRQTSVDILGWMVLLARWGGFLLPWPPNPRLKPHQNTESQRQQPRPQSSTTFKHGARGRGSFAP